MKDVFYFDAVLAGTIIEAARRRQTTIEISLDLNLSRQTCTIQNGRLIINENTEINLELIQTILSKKNKIVMCSQNDLRPLEITDNGYYKLVPTDSAPILEINGIKMHRSKTIDPLEDARQKAKLVVRHGDTVLDTCGGLGYSALYCLKAGALKVISTEKSREVVRLRAFNPWIESRMDEGLEFCRADILDKIHEFKNGQFNSVIHDPPRFSSATGDLYGIFFYSQLLRVLGPGGRLFHYTGSPKRIKKQDSFVQNTIKRLARAGFSALKYVDRLQGIYAEKPAV